MEPIFVKFQPAPYTEVPSLKEAVEHINIYHVVGPLLPHKLDSIWKELTLLKAFELYWLEDPEHHASCAWDLERSANCMLRMKARLNREKSSKDMLTYIAERQEEIALMLLHCLEDNFPLDANSVSLQEKCRQYLAADPLGWEELYDAFLLGVELTSKALATAWRKMDDMGTLSDDYATLHWKFYRAFEEELRTYQLRFDGWEE